MYEFDESFDFGGIGSMVEIGTRRLVTFFVSPTILIHA